jgi:hypothetical protein
MWGRHENVWLQMDDYSLKTRMFSIEMGGCDIVFCFEWLKILGSITIDFHELYKSFYYEGHIYTFKGIKANYLETICSHHIKKLLKKGHLGIVAQFHAIQAFATPSQPIHPEMQLVLAKQPYFFETPQVLPPSQGENDHSNILILGILPPNVLPYHHPFSQKIEIKKIV